jgi:type I restriction-modification system DNA methylase subunit
VARCLVNHVSHQSLTEEEQKSLKDILEDLSYLFSLEEILPDQIDNVLDKLSSEEVKAYIDNLRKGSKPEVALREAFLAGKDATLTKYLFGHLVPEENIGPGFIDYQVAASPNRFIILELKSLFESEVEVGKGGVRNLVRIKQAKLRPDVHKEQIVKYVRKGGEFVILTNLREWLFYNENAIVKFYPFHKTDLLEFVKEFDVTTNIVDYLERNEYESIREDLDKRFFESLKSWVGKLSEVEFELDEKSKIEAIIGLINKFIFIQTLDDHGVVDFRWIRTTWEHAEQRWHAKGKLQVLKKFFEEVMEFFWSHYDTELFQGEVLANLKQTEKNIELFYRNLLLVLGIAYWQTGVGGYKGIMQYNFKFIDEDIFGKAYETFLADVRHDEGIYYTPRYITQYIVEDTVGRIFGTLLDEIKASLQREDFDRTKELSERFISIRVVDPACGSGSFLIKAVRKIWSLYKELDSVIATVESKYSKFEGTLVRPKDAEKKLESILEIKQLLRITNDRELVCHILVRHIHANDLDIKALSVAKVNIWLEAIKLTPKQFRYDTLPEGTNYVLPHLEMNFRNGDSLVGLPEDMTVEYLSKNHKDRIIQLFQLRNQYVKEPTNPELIAKVEQILGKLRTDVDEEFKRYLKGKELPVKILDQTKPFHWALEFWYFYFDEKGEPLGQDFKGADVIIGNPPYERIQVLTKKAPLLVEYLDNAGYAAATKNYDLAVIFVEKGYRLLGSNGQFGYIVTNKFMQADYGEGLRKFLTEKMAVREIVDFGDQQVFDATTYTLLLFLKKVENRKVKYTLVRKLEKTLQQFTNIAAIEAGTDRTFSVLSTDANALTSSPWVFATTDEQTIIQEIAQNKTLKLVGNRIFQGLVTGADPVFILGIKSEGNGLTTASSNSRGKDYVIEKAVLRPLLKGEDIKKWNVKGYEQVALFPYLIEDGKATLISPSDFRDKYPRAWKYLLDNRETLEKRERGKWKGVKNWYAYGRRQNLEQFDQPKIMTQVLAHRASFALDTQGLYYFVGGGNAGGYGITLRKDAGISLEYACGLLNSSLLDWQLKKRTSKFRGGFYSYARRFIQNLAIKIPSTDEDRTATNKIESLVRSATKLKQMRYTILSAWRSTSIALKNSERTLSAILIQDGASIRAGNFAEAWSRKVPFYPNGDNPLITKQYVDFTVTGDNERPRLMLYGLDDENKEELIYEIEFQTREHMLHVYLSISLLLDSRSKPQTLADVLEKTSVPIIQPDIFRNTPNIIHKIKEDLSKSNSDNRIPAHDLVIIENELEEVEAKIDSIAFALYRLDESDIYLIMESLSLLQSYQQRVLSFFSKGV